MREEFWKKYFSQADKRFEMLEASFKVGLLFEYDKWKYEIPYLNFKPEWEVKILPPFGGAIIRFYIRHKDYPKMGIVSVYLDCYSLLGVMDGPYWEIYPNELGETSRVSLKDTEILIKKIEDSIEYWSHEDALDE